MLVCRWVILIIASWKHSEQIAKYFAEKRIIFEDKLWIFMFQVWQGNLLLCDYIMDKPDVFADRFVLELGGGMGPSSITAGVMAKTVFCTGWLWNAFC